MNQNALTILTIDDDEEIRYALKALFDFQGWQVQTAANVREGLELFKRHRPDIVLIDYHMPQLNGLEGVKMLKRLDSNVPIIVFTIDENQEVADRFMEAGASDFALKPIKAPDIISRIKLHVRLMEESRKNASPTVKGIGEPTLARIRECLLGAEEYITAREIAETTGLSYQTTFRYLQHLLAEGMVDSQSTYGKVGRPKQSFAWKE